MSQKISEVDFLILLCCLKQITFSGSFDELKLHQLCKLITIQKWKHMLSISCKSAQKVAPIIAT